MATITKYKSGTIDSISSDGLTLTVTLDDSDTLAGSNGEAGRLVYITNDNDSQGRYREIASNTSTTVTLEAPFGLAADTTNQGPFRGLVSGSSDTNGYSAVNEKPIAATDTFVISKTMAEAASEDADIVDNSFGSVSAYSATGTAVTIPDGVCVYGKDLTFEYDYQNTLRISPGGALILGKQNLGDVTDSDIIGYTSNSCTMIDVSASYVSGTILDRGAFHMNGGYFIGTATGNGTFYRFYGDITPGSAAQNRQSFRMWNVSVSGKIGSRVSGHYTVLLDNFSAGNDSDFGFSNALVTAINQGNKVVDAQQAAYISTQLGGSTTIRDLDVQDINVRLFNINSSTGGTTQSMVGWDLGAVDDILQGACVINQGGTNSSVMNWEKDFLLDFTNADGSAVAINGKVRFHDTTDTVTSSGTIDTVLGSTPEQTLVKYSHNLAGTRSSFQHEQVTESTPYTWASLFRGKSLVTGSTDLLGPIGKIEQSFPLIDDANITETDSSVVDAYTELDTAQKLYDYQYKFKDDNMEMPTLQTVPFTIAGDLVTTTDSTADVTFDSSNTNNIDFVSSTNVYTVKSATTGYVGGIECTNAIFDATIQGEVNATTAAFSGTIPGTIIDTNEKVKSTIAIATDGTYYIDGGADISELTINAGDSNSAVVIVIVDAIETVGDNSFTVGAGVTKQKTVAVTVALDAAYDSAKLRRFRWAGATTAAEYASATKKDHTDATITTDGNNVTFALDIDSTDNVYLYMSYDGIEHIALINQDGNTTVDPVFLTSAQIDFDATATTGSDDETLEGLTPTVGKDTSGTAFDAIGNEVHIVVPTTSSLQSLTANFDKKFTWRAMHTIEWADGVLEGYVTNNSFKFTPTSTVLDFVSGSTEEARFLGNYTKTSSTGVIQYASRITNASDADIRTTISGSTSDIEVRFGINASGASFAEVSNAVKDVYLNDGSVQQRQEDISQISYFKP